MEIFIEEMGDFLSKTWGFHHGELIGDMSIFIGDIEKHY